MEQSDDTFWHSPERLQSHRQAFYKSLADEVAMALANFYPVIVDGREASQMGRKAMAYLSG
jgi:hypothetical protein